MCIPSLHDSLAMFSASFDLADKPETGSQRASRRTTPYKVCSWWNLFDAFKHVLLSNHNASRVISNDSVNWDIPNDNNVSSEKSIMGFHIWDQLWRNFVNTQ